MTVHETILVLSNLLTLLLVLDLRNKTVMYKNREQASDAWYRSKIVEVERAKADLMELERQVLIKFVKDKVQ